MRILISAGMIQRGQSGVGQYVIHLVKALKRILLDAKIFVVGFKEDRILFDTITDENWISIPSNVSQGALNFFWHQLRLPKILKEKKIDIVHVPSYRRILWSQTTTQVATIHDCAPFVLKEKYDFLRGFFGRSIIPHFARRVAKIVTVSESTHSDLIHFMKIERSKIQVILNGIDHDVFLPQNERDQLDFRKKKNLPPFYFIYVSRLEHPGKNHIRLIEAFEKLKQNQREISIKLILVGARWHGHEKIFKRLEGSPFKKDIRIEGFVDMKALPLWYSCSTAMIFPSLMEGFGLPVVEAQASGTLVACSNTTSLSEVAGPSLLFNPTDIDQIANAMTAIIQLNSGERERRVEASLRWAKLFSWDRAAMAYAALYRDLLYAN